MIGDWLTVEEVGKQIGASARHVRRLLDSTRFMYFPGAYRMPGGHWRIPRGAVDDFLESRRAASSSVKRRKPGQKNNGTP